MGIIYKGKIQIILLVLFFMLSLNVKANCSEQDIDDFLEFIKTPVCELDSENWIQKCNTHKGNCYTMTIASCAGAEFKACDKLLNEEYQKTMERAKATYCRDVDREDEGCQWERLKQAELSWIKFRDDDCKVGVDFMGTVSRIDNTWCRTEKTKERIKQLRKFFK